MKRKHTAWTIPDLGKRNAQIAFLQKDQINEEVTFITLQCLFSAVVNRPTCVSLRHDCECDGRPDSHDHVHRLSDGLGVPGLHPLLCPERLLHHLHYHICTELHSTRAQLQEAGLLERGLEATAKAGLKGGKKWKYKDKKKNNNKTNVISEHLTCHRETLLPNQCLFCVNVNMKIPNLKKMKILGPQITSSFAFTKEGFKTDLKNGVFLFSFFFFWLVFCVSCSWGMGPE